MPTTTLADPPPQGPDLDALSAIAAHMRWKARLEERLSSGRSESLDSRKIMRNRHCTLGRWLQGPGQKRLGTCEAFADVLRQHAAFHRLAAWAVMAEASGRHEDALRVLQSTDYARASRRLCQSLVRLFDEAKNKAP